MAGRTPAAAVSPAARFRAALENARRVHIDARVLVYHLLATPRFLELTRLLFAGLRTGAVTGQTSSIALYQILAEPWRRGEGERAEEVARHLSIYPGLDLVPVSDELAVQAARVRAELGGGVERALHIATALGAGADLFLTDGSGLRRVAGMRVVNLADHV